MAGHQTYARDRMHTIIKSDGSTDERCLALAAPEGVSTTSTLPFAVIYRCKEIYRYKELGYIITRCRHL